MHLKKIIFSLFFIWLTVNLWANTPELNAPANQATNVSKTPLLEWTGSGTSYTVEVYECSPDNNNTGGLGLDNFDLQQGPSLIAQIPNDLSGITYNANTNTLFASTNGDTRIHEMDLSGNYIREIILNGFQDTEGIVWIGGNDFFVLEERKGRAVPITINSSTSSIAYPSGYIQLPGTWGNNLGIEGVCYDPATNQLLIVKEKSPLTLYSFEIPSNLSSPVTVSVTNPFNIASNNFGFTDLAGMHFLGATAGLSEMNVNDHFFILSHESRALVETDATGTEYSRIELVAGGANGTITVDFPQAEGVTVDNDGNIYVVSEPNIFYVLSNPNIDLTPFNTGTTEVSQNVGAANSYAVTTALASNTEYCWRVRDNSTGLWSEYWSFTTLPNTAPNIQIDSPTNGSIFNDLSPVNIGALANDSDGNIAEIEFFVNGMSIGTVTGSNTNINFTPPGEGVYDVYAIATDNEGATTTSAVIQFIVDFPNQAPNISFIAPMNGAVFNTLDPILIIANADDPDGNIAQVEFFIDGVSVEVVTTGSPYATAFIPSAEGTYTVYAVATDNEGAMNTTASIDITIDLPNQAPNIMLTSPTNGAIFNSLNPIMIMADANDADGNITQVEFFVEGISIGTTTTGSPYMMSFTPPIEGEYEIYAIATDNDGGTALSSTIEVVVEFPNQAPNISLTSPMNGTVFNTLDPIIMIADANDPDGSITQVEFFVEGISVGIASSGAPYAINFTPPIEAIYSIYAVATDNDGAMSSTSMIEVTVDLEIAIKETDFFSDFKLFPNPADAYINLSFDAVQAINNSKITIYDKQGKRVKSHSMDILAGQSIHNFAIEQLASGAYILNIEADGQVLLTRNFIKK